MNLSGKKLIVSGGSRGLGLAIVMHYLDRGCWVSTFARQPSKAVELLQQRFGKSFVFQVVDAGDAVGVGQFVDKTCQDFSGIDALVNNAAIGQDHLLANMSAAMISEIMTVNLEAPIVLTRAVVRHMLLNQTRGRIVNVSSICGSRGYPGLTVYSATKGGLDAFTRSLARELGERGILVNGLAPGFFESQMSSVLAPNQLATIRRRTPTGQLCTEADVLPILDVLLFGDTNVTGQVVAVDGGSSS